MGRENTSVLAVCSGVDISPVAALLINSFHGIFSNHDNTSPHTHSSTHYTLTKGWAV